MLMRTAPNPGKNTKCDEPGVFGHQLRIDASPGFTVGGKSLRVRVGKPWVISEDGAWADSFHGGVSTEGCLVLATTYDKPKPVNVLTKDPHAPIRNVVIES